MLKDNRYYVRTAVSVPAILHENRHHKEISCMVKDVSEKGICFEIPADDSYSESLCAGESIHFQFIDTYQYGKEAETDVLSNDCTIRYVKMLGNLIRIGCYVSGEDFSRYAVRREVVSGLRRAATA